MTTSIRSEAKKNMDGKADKVSYRAFKKRIETILKKSKKITKPMKKISFMSFEA